MVKLNKTVAAIIARRYFPRCKLEEVKGAGGARTYKAGNGYLSLTIANDWLSGDGMINVWLNNPLGEVSIYIKLDPETMEPVPQKEE